MSNFENITIPFGKNRGTPLVDLDAGYLNWMLRKATDPSAWGGLVDFVDAHGDDIRAAIQAISRREAERFEVTYELNASQSEAVDRIEAELLDGDADMFRLEGGAGYGKSFTVVEVVRRAKLAGYIVNACATSYVATQVLAKQLSVLGVEAKTIASTMRLEKWEEEDREDYIPSERTADALAKLLSHKRLLIVDEWSMVTDELADMMMRAVRACGGKLLVVGDIKQLPPVGQNTPSRFSTIEASYTLSEPMRYSVESDLFHLEQLARHSPRGIKNGGWQGSEEVVMTPSLDALVECFVDDTEANPQDDARMLFFRRKDVADANATIRTRLFGERAWVEPVVEDERLMVLSTADILVTEKGEPVRFYSGETFLVERVERGEVEGIPCYITKLSNGCTVPVIINVPGSLGSDEFRSRLNELREHGRETGDWTPWRKFKNSFLSVGYNYAMTVHRCQGQTVDRVYFAPGMLRGGSMTNALIYVAATRAKQRVYMVP